VKLIENMNDAGLTGFEIANITEKRGKEKAAYRGGTKAKMI